MELATRFLSEANDGRDLMRLLFQLQLVMSPPLSLHFQSWDHEYINKQTFVDPYAAKLAASKAQQEESAPQRMAALKKVEAPVGFTAPPPAPEPEPTAAPATPGTRDSSAW